MHSKPECMACWEGASGWSQDDLIEIQEAIAWNSKEQKAKDAQGLEAATVKGSAVKGGTVKGGTSAVPTMTLKIEFANNKSMILADVVTFAATTNLGPSLPSSSSSKGDKPVSPPRGTKRPYY